MQVVSYTFKNPKIVNAIYSNQNYLVEIIAFMLGEKVIVGPNEEPEFHSDMYNYLLTILDPLDIPSAQLIMDEIEKHINHQTNDYVFRSLYLTGEVFLKYDYRIEPRFSRIQFYSIDDQFDNAC